MISNYFSQSGSKSFYECKGCFGKVKLRDCYRHVVDCKDLRNPSDLVQDDLPLLPSGQVGSSIQFN